jgi:hypothetical protein
MQVNQLMMAQVIINYADQVNSQFSKNKSQYVGLGKRLSDTIANKSFNSAIINDAVDEFKIRNPEFKKWEDLELCEPGETTLDKIDIDITLQRLLELIHVCNIMDSFKQILVQPICVYKDPSRPGRYICWEGQHTSIVLYIIAAMVLGEDISKCKVPIIINPSSQKSEMRECFITMATPEVGKKSLDPIDLFQQMLFGVRTDGTTNKSEWVAAEKKQQALENAKMFATNQKFGDTHMPGALSVLTEFMNPIYEVEITEAFTKYFVNVCKSSRPVKPKESWMMYEYFRLCKVNDIKLTDAYIRDVAKSLKSVTGSDFDADMLFSKAKVSYQEWFRDNKPSPDGTLWGITYPEKRIGLTFLIAQISKNFKGTIPNYSGALWRVPTKDLF